MKTTIKIHDSKWFKEHCRVTATMSEFNALKPSYEPWNHIRTIHWLQGGVHSMSPLEGKVLKVELDSGIDAGLMSDARYMAKRFWIPNWAIEWIKEKK